MHGADLHADEERREEGMSRFVMFLFGAALASCSAGGTGSGGSDSLDGQWVLTGVQVVGTQGNLQALPLGSTFLISGGQLVSVTRNNLTTLADQQSQTQFWGRGLQTYQNDFNNRPASYSYGWDDLDVGGDQLTEQFTESSRSTNSVTMNYYFSYREGAGLVPVWLVATYYLDRIAGSDIDPGDAYASEPWDDPAAVTAVGAVLLPDVEGDKEK